MRLGTRLLILSIALGGLALSEQGHAQSSGDPAVNALYAELVAELTPECRKYGGSTVRFDRGALKSSGKDVIVDFHFITCPGASGVLLELGVGNCGAAECLQRVYSLRQGRYVETRSYWQ